MVFAGMVGPRSASNVNHYSLKDAVLGAFAGFSMQNESFLEFKRRMAISLGEHNSHKY